MTYCILVQISASGIISVWCRTRWSKTSLFSQSLTQNSKYQFSLMIGWISLHFSCENSDNKTVDQYNFLIIVLLMYVLIMWGETLTDMKFFALVRGLVMVPCRSSVPDWHWVTSSFWRYHILFPYITRCYTIVKTVGIQSKAYDTRY